PREPWTVDGTRLVADLVAHPGPTVGFRIETATSSFAYLPDHEPALAGIADRSRDWISGAVIAEDVDLLLHDAQYFEDEYEERIGWGHSSVADAVAFAGVVGGRRVRFGGGRRAPPPGLLPPRAAPHRRLVGAPRSPRAVACQRE